MSLRVVALLLLAACSSKPTDADGGADDTDVAVADTQVDLGPDVDHDGSPAALDCDDLNPLVHPGAVEACNGADDDCDGHVDRAETAFPGALGPFFKDADVDGFGDDATARWQCTVPTAQGWITVGGDCDDADPNRRPDTAEICDGVDNDCDSLVDGDDPSLVYASSPSAVFRFFDGDGDGYGTGNGQWHCTDPGTGWAVTPGDCDDAHASAHPGAAEVWYDDLDEACDGGDDWDQDHDLYEAVGSPNGGTDCDDTHAGVHLGAVEVPYNGLDDDCTGGDLCDVDRDGVPAATGSCGGTDCDDRSAIRFPGNTEICDFADNDCDNLVDDADPGISVASQTVFFRDADGDTYGDPAVSQRFCGVTHTGFATRGTDCDDARSDVNPGRQEVCDGVDDDCDTLTDDADSSVLVTAPWYHDRDGDGFPAPTGVVTCAQPPGTVHAAGVFDCDDAVGTTFPGAAQAESSTACRADADDDGYGSRVAPPGGSAGGDCDDAVAAAHPGAAEVWYDGIDEACDGGDDWDQDRDGYAATSRPGGGTDCLDTNAAVNPGKTEVPYNGLDDDCAGGDLCDVDRDGVASTAAACGGTDCADNDATRSPDLPELCNGKDDDCDNLVDEADPGISPALLHTLYVDGDRDGYGLAAQSRAFCATSVAGYASVAGDCADGDAAVHPGADEVCDGKDDDCDTLIDDADPGVVVQDPWGVDDDGDGWAVADTLWEQCAQPGPRTARYAGIADCDDADDLTFPGVASHEVALLCCTDADGDGWGGEDPVPGVQVGHDCDDLVAAVHPGATEVWYDGVDQDCDAADDWDQDRDGHEVLGHLAGDDCDDTRSGVHPGATEIAGNGLDDDCVGGDACAPGASAACPATSCQDIKTQGLFTTSGTYWIQPAATAFEVRCELSLDNGGWTQVAVVSDDGQNTWTYTNRLYWTTSTTYFGTPGDGRDLRSRAFRELPFTDVLFVHRPDGVWARYRMGTGTQDVGTRWNASSASICYGTSVVGTNPAAGTLVSGGSLCATTLVFNAQASNGSSTCTAGYASFGPTWSVRPDTSYTCPLWYPGYYSGLGPYEGNQGTESTALGWGYAKGTNSGASGTGANRMEVYVR